MMSGYRHDGLSASLDEPGPGREMAYQREGLDDKSPTAKVALHNKARQNALDLRNA